MLVRWSKCRTVKRNNAHMNRRLRAPTRLDILAYLEMALLSRTEAMNCSAQVPKISFKSGLDSRRPHRIHLHKQAARQARTTNRCSPSSTSGFSTRNRRFQVHCSSNYSPAAGLSAFECAAAVTTQLVANSTPHAEDSPMVAVEGDTVTIHFTCRDGDGKVLQSSKEDGDPVSFEIGVGNVTGNNLFQAFDEVVRGLAAGQTAELEAQGPAWVPELFFEVPRDHPEVQRLEGRYKNLGGLKEGLVVELANGGMAMVVSETPESVRLDANSMMAGKNLVFEIELVSIERGH